MANSKKLVFFGNERLATATSTAAPVLKALVAAGYEIEAVIASHEDAVSRQKRDLEIGPVAHRYGIPVILPGPKPDWVAKLKNHQTEAAVLVAFGRLIPKSVINLFPLGIINLHPSLLPKFRGPTPIESAILDGATETGVSLMKLVPKMDAGPIYAQAKVTLRGNETKQQLADKLSGVGAQLLTENLAAILAGTLKPRPQPDSRTSYTKLISKADGMIDLSQPAVTLEREIRAYSGWPKSRTEIYGHQVIVTKARVVQNKSAASLILQAKPGFLEILELIGPSGRTMSGVDFLRGYTKR